MIRIIRTGGTIEKVYNSQNGLMDFSESFNYIELLRRCADISDFTIETLFTLDSLDMTQKHRDQIFESVLKSTQKSIIVSHGTDTMVESAQFVSEQHWQIMDKTVVFFGAMIPASINNSDAQANLAAAIMTCQLLSPGVYIAMHGKVFNPMYTQKNHEKLIFEMTR